MKEIVTSIILVIVGVILIPMVIFGLAIYGCIAGVDEITGEKSKHRVWKSIWYAFKGTINIFKHPFKKSK